ncbi:MULTISPECIES: hypothetical protein [unclassified Bifidobacterium]|nr:MULTISPECIES: hypothetical protein [unclassified Bifidobacterium]
MIAIAFAGQFSYLTFEFLDEPFLAGDDLVSRIGRLSVGRLSVG